MKFYYPFVLLFFITLSCNKNNTTPDPLPSLPTVKTTAFSSITPLTALAGGDVTADGGATVISRGICWGSLPAPLLSGNHTTDGAGTGTFSSSLTGLNPGTLYYARAYAINSVGTSYGNEISFTTTVPDVYSAGYEYNNNAVSVAKVWKNGVETVLSSGFSTEQGWARAVYVSGTDVYVVGYEFNGLIHTAKLWKNGTSTSLTNGNYEAQAWAISVSGTDVYAGGYEKNAAGKKVAKIWKNGVQISITDGTNDAQVYGIFIYGADVYAVGFETISGISTAKLWKNGIGSTLPVAGTNTTAYAVFVSGTNVYVAGNEIIAGGYSKAILWVNDVPSYLTNGFSSIAIPYSVFVNGADVYVAGFDQSTGTGLSKATLWKNGTASSLTDGSTYARANSVYVFNNDVYVSGYELIWPNSVSKTWKNGTLIHSTNGTFNAASASVFVK
jgi:hypothetical protein